MNIDNNVNYTLELLQRDKLARTHIINELLMLKEKFKIQQSNILELGCGLGQNLCIFQEDNCVKGIEGLPDVVSMATSLGLDVVQGDLEYPLINIADASQDWVLCLDVLEHLVKPFDLLLEIKRILKPNGKAVLNVPNHLEIRGRLKILLGSGMDVHNYFSEYDEWENPHIRFFTYAGFIKMIHSTGFSVLEDRSYRFSTLPLSKYIKKLGAEYLLEFLIKQNPSLFSLGFFVILAKQ
ncbi:MAG: class I SAM-dependent methyltransferase [Gloeotrichia echinulata DVL01]|jgi:methionine biosynthesis protein MetW